MEGPLMKIALLSRSVKKHKCHMKLLLLVGQLKKNSLQPLGQIKVITKLPNSEQSYKGKVKTHNYINRQNQSTTGKL